MAIKTELFQLVLQIKKKEVNIMSNLVLYKGVYISKEQFDEIKNMRQLSDEEIDYSDIPPTSDEQLARMKANRLFRKKMKVAS